MRQTAVWLWGMVRSVASGSGCGGTMWCTDCAAIDLGEPELRAAQFRSAAWLDNGPPEAD